MGSNNTRKKYISIEDLDTVNFSHIDKLFELNSNGFINIVEFNKLFDGRLKLEILRKLFAYFRFDKKNLSKDDLKYLYFIFTNRNNYLKICFICDLIFKKNKKKYSKYQEKVHFYFSPNEEIHKLLLSERIRNLIDRANCEIQKEQVKNFLVKNCQDFFSNFSFVKPLEKKDFLISSKSLNNTAYTCFKKDDEVFYISNYEINCRCCLMNRKSAENKINKKPNEKILVNPEYENLINSIKDEFNNIERRNDNLFTISLFEKMMKEIDTNIIVISLISSYLKKKTQKVRKL